MAASRPSSSCWWAGTRSTRGISTRRARTRCTRRSKRPKRRVGQAQAGGLSFPTEEAKDAEAEKLFTDLATRHSGSAEGEIAYFFLGSMMADEGKLAEAEKDLLEASQKADAKYASLAKLSLAQIYFEDGQSAQGEQTLRDLIAHPTIFVSSDQAAIALARQLAVKNPAEARKLLLPLLSKPGGIGSAASDANSEIPQ